MAIAIFNLIAYLMSWILLVQVYCHDPNTKANDALLQASNVRNIHKSPITEDEQTPATGQALILTDYIKSGRIDEARNLSLVKPPFLNITSYAGFLTVDEICESNMFFWFFPAEENIEDAPVMVWLQGGPGVSSLYGLLNENGPIALDEYGNLYRRNHSWTRVSSILYIDNPVGAGFSFTNKDCYSTNQTHVAANLLETLKQFYKLFPNLKNNQLFLSGHSYAGKYVPALGYAIHMENVNNTSPINLTGLAIGNGLVDPLNQLSYGDFLYYIGLIDDSARKIFLEEEETCRYFINHGNWSLALVSFLRLMPFHSSNIKSHLENFTDFHQFYHFVDPVPLEDKFSRLFYFFEFFKIPSNRMALGVGEVTFKIGGMVQQYLMEDMTKSVAPWLEVLLEHYQVLIYTGQMDIIVNYPGVVSYVKKLRWSGSKQYVSSNIRRPWYVEDQLAGYVKTAGKLTEVMVRNAGHSVPSDQPKWTFDLISNFVKGTNFSNVPFPELV